MQSFPQPLSAAQETVYLRQYQNGDMHARDILIERNLRLVAHIVKKYMNSGKETDEMISVGIVGLVKAVNTYNFEKGSRLATYAARCIDNELPFEIPETWEWVRLGTVFQHNTGKALNASNRDGEKLTYITTSNLYWDRFVLDNLKTMPFTDSEVDKCTVQQGDLLVCEGGDIGRAAIWESATPMRIQNHIHRLRAYVPVCTRFFYHLFYLYKGAGWIGGKGIAIQGLSSNAIHNLLFPLPPLHEQERIVSAIDTALSVVQKL